ncbi:MAG: adenosylmethionine--8-amino-7-oxononanoate transaminase, partial [Anaerovorax sp.]
EQMKTMKNPYKIVDAEGVYIYTKDQKLIDSVSSWWSVIHGYKHPQLNQAILSQVEKFSHVMIGGLTHEPVEKLSKKLEDWLPGDLDYCFFSDSGSVAVEVALKMALQYFMNQGIQGRTMVMALECAYHGDTFKTMEVGDDEDYHFVLNAYGKSEYVVHIPTEIQALEKAFATHHDQLNSFIVEPLLQGAAGMLMYDISFLKRARELCDEYGVLLIFDEVATGFGRTGHRFVADVVEPDILILGKALTGGYIGHAVTVANHKVYDGFYSDDPTKALMHGPTFMGNALACSVALKSIELFENGDYMAKIRRIEEITKDALVDFSDSRIKDIRVMGGCVCIEVYDPTILNGYQEFAYSRGVFSRPFLNYLYAMVPYVISEAQLVQVLDTMKAWFRR